MDFGKAISFTFDDPEWITKVAIGGVVTLVPILNFAAYGYSIEVTRRVIDGHPQPLPAWDDFGGKFIKGLLYFVIGLVYSLPILLIACLAVGGMAATGSLASSSSRSAGEAAGGVFGLVMLCVSCIITLYGIVVAIVLPAAVGHYAAKDEIGAAFRFADVLSLVQRNLGAYLMVFAISFVAGLLASVVGSLACGIGLIFAGFWSLLVIGHATGQAYRQASASIGLV
jgi:hypothetical protein